MKLIGPVAPPGVRHIVRLKDNTQRVAFMAMHRDGMPDGTWVSDGEAVEAVEVIGRYRPEPFKALRKKPKAEMEDP